MEHYAGIDVSLEYSSVCVVEASGKIVREGKVASEPDALIGWLGSLGYELSRIGLEVAPCRNGFLRQCGKRGWRLSCWRRGTSTRHSRRCR